MADCCTNTACEIEKLRERQRSTLLWVLWINAVLFVTEGTAGVLASSTALLADSLDMLGDALVYAFSLYVVSRDRIWKARAATFKGWIMLVFGLAVLGQAVYKMLVPTLPHAPTMGVIGALVLAGNGVCLWLLWRHRAEDINMRSVWLCSRNDIVANTSVLAAGALVWALQSRWPDIVVGLAIAVLFLSSARNVLRDAAKERRNAEQEPAAPAAQVAPGPVLVSLEGLTGPRLSRVAD
jgi:Co/Zn/Cd efflux system component